MHGRAEHLHIYWLVDGAIISSYLGHLSVVNYALTKFSQADKRQNRVFGTLIRLDSGGFCPLMS